MQGLKKIQDKLNDKLTKRSNKPKCNICINPKNHHVGARPSGNVILKKTRNILRVGKLQGAV